MAPINNRNNDRGDSASGSGTQRRRSLSPVSNRSSSTSSDEAPDQAGRNRNRANRRERRRAANGQPDRAHAQRAADDDTTIVRVRHVWDLITLNNLREMYRGVDFVLRIVKRNRRNGYCDLDFHFRSRQAAEWFLLTIRRACEFCNNTRMIANILP
nr:uncharacterized protein LOC111414221 [Onthophagus taurus]